LIPYGPFSLRNQAAMPGVLRRERLDVYHAPNFMIPFPAFPAGRRGRTACVVTIHDLIPLIFPEHTPRALKTRFHPVYRRVMREVGRRADLIVTVSDFSRRDIIRHMRIPADRADRVVAIPEGVAPEYRPAERRTDAAAEHVILYVGRMDPYKNVTGLIEAFRRILRDHGLRVRLKLIGPRDDRYPDVQRAIVAHNLTDAVDWPGYVSGDALREAYQTADVFVLPSLYEGFGLPVLEAMASGAPVVCGNRASLPEVAGDAALLVDPEDRDALTDAVLRVLTRPDEATRLRDAGVRRAAQFSWARTARETIAAYARAAGRT